MHHNSLGLQCLFSHYEHSYKANRSKCQDQRTQSTTAQSTPPPAPSQAHAHDGTVTVPPTRAPVSLGRSKKVERQVTGLANISELYWGNRTSLILLFSSLDLIFRLEFELMLALVEIRSGEVGKWSTHQQWTGRCDEGGRKGQTRLFYSSQQEGFFDQESEIGFQNLYFHSWREVGRSDGRSGG